VVPRSEGAPSFDYTATPNPLGYSQTEFVVGPAGGSFSIGGLYTIRFPANSVCDPARSGYGADQWDSPCETLADGQGIKIQATLSLGASGLGVEFSPALRFSPSTEVTIATDIFAATLKGNRDYFLKNHSALNSLAILYSTNLGGAASSDYAADRSLVTHIDLTTGQIWRRIKHFSGYSMTSGSACMPAPENPDCVDVH